MYHILLAIHLLAATIWTGGHLVLFFGFLLPALRRKDVAIVTSFESRYEKIGIPALLLLVVTGLWLAWLQMPDLSLWFSLKSVISRTVTLKLTLLLATAALALHARLGIIPTLSPQSLPQLTGHVFFVTVFAVLFALAGLWQRFGGLW